VEHREYPSSTINLIVNKKKKTNLSSKQLGSGRVRDLIKMLSHGIHKEEMYLNTGQFPMFGVFFLSYFGSKPCLAEEGKGKK